VRSQASGDTSLAVVLSRAYASLAAHSPDAAALFERAAAMDSTNVLVRMQLGYLYQSQKQYDLAAAHFLAADRFHPSDSTRLQAAYALSSAGRKEESDALLQSLRDSRYPDIRDAANSQLAASSPTGSASDWWTRVYAAPYYDTRWNTTFFQFNLERGYSLTSDRKLGAYGTVMYSGDARSGGGQVPVIFSDNSLILGLGLRARPLTGLSVSVQEGIAFDVVSRPTSSSPRNDFRAVAVYSYGIYAPFNVHPEVKTPFYPWADMYSSFGYYSRYEDGIGYLQGRLGLRVLEVSKTAGDVYLRGDLVRDTEKLFYNNEVEGSVGLRLIPDVDWGFYLAAEFHRGTYWDVGGPPVPYDSYYSSFRFFLIFDRTF
jgi:tetratricopeptide (TPR) repeat protein